MLDYVLVTIATLMFGVQFLLNNLYQRESGNGIGATMTFAFIGGIIGIVSLTLINGFSFSATPFTLIMALLSALLSIAYTFCSLKAFEKINLSLYSLFAMLGGMIIPFFQGIMFYDEPVTVAKAICVVFVIAALVICATRNGKKGGFIYYLGVFVLNGLSGVFSKIFQASSYEKTSEAMYSIWSAAIKLLISAVVIAILIILSKKRRDSEPMITMPSPKALIFGSAHGVFNAVANFILLLSLASLPASAQYPFITGGVIIASTVISAIMGSKPSKKEIISVILSFIGLLALVFIPI
jgi:drug/metabolite transporter (DMT)-like permease